MLLEFSLTNFRSYRTKQTFTMAAAPRLGKRQNVFRSGVKGEVLPGLLKVAAIYGPNASGKSGLLAAMEAVVSVLRREPSNAGAPLPAKPFRFDSTLANEPSEFELHFIQNEMRYEYILGLTKDRIVRESLTSYPKGRERHLFDRVVQDNKEIYNFGDLEGGKDLHSVWQKLTGPKTAFLAQAVANSSEELHQLREPLKWLTESVLLVNQDTMRSWSLASRKLIKQYPDLVKDFTEFFQEVDVPITDINVEDIAQDDDGLILNVESGLVSKEESTFFGNKTTLTHTTALGNAEFDFSEESGGTQNLIGFWLPWMTMTDSLRGPYKVILVDELDSSLHPEIVSALIHKHIASNSTAQLIFTTHDTHLMKERLLRRDQFWITDRDKDGATSLFSIHDFRGREGEDVEKRYFEGRYRGLPVIRREQKVLKAERT